MLRVVSGIREDADDSIVKTFEQLCELAPAVMDSGLQVRSLAECEDEFEMAVEVPRKGEPAFLESVGDVADFEILRRAAEDEAEVRREGGEADSGLRAEEIVVLRRGAATTSSKAM